MQLYIQENLPDMSPDDQSRLLHIVRYMGNPNYELKDGKEGINNHANAEERSVRNYMHRILTIAHKLDLPRCYGSQQFQQSIKIIAELSEQSEEQKLFHNQLIKYSIELIKAHGAMLHCDFDSNTGKFMDVSRKYCELYAQTSNQLKRLFDVSDTVQKPRF